MQMISETASSHMAHIEFVSSKCIELYYHNRLICSIWIHIQHIFKVITNKVPTAFDSNEKLCQYFLCLAGWQTC